MRRRLRRLLILGTLLAGIGAACGLACALYANHVVVSDSVDAIFRKTGSVPARPVAIVFGAMLWRSGPSDTLRDRLDAGIRLYRAGKVRKLLLSGDHGQRVYNEVGVMREYVEAQGVPPEDVFLDHAGFRTYDTLYRARDVFGVSSAVLVTQAFHLPRAVYTAPLGLDVAGLVADARVYRRRGFNRRREFLARSLAWFDLHVRRPRPKYLGPTIDISGDGRVTRD